jgi:hypothetical protein
MLNRKQKEKMTWKDVKHLLSFGVGTLCGLILRDSDWLDALSVKLGRSAAIGIGVAVAGLVGVALFAILGIIDKLIEKRHQRKQKASP